MTPEASQRKERLIAICTAFPEVEATGDPHIAFRVRRKTFAYYLYDHHGDGKIALTCKATFEDQDFLLRLDPERFYKPAYVGVNGWIGARLDLPDVDWSEIHDLVANAYRLVAPKRLIAQMQPGGDELPTMSS